MSSPEEVDVSLFTTGKDKKIEEPKVVEPSVRPRVRSCRMAAAARRNRRPVLCLAPQSPRKFGSNPILSQPKTQTSSFHWQKSGDIVIDSLDGLSFTITGTMDRISRDDLVEMIEWCGGTVYKTLAKKSKYLIVGDNGSKAWIRKAIQMGKEVVDEDAFFELVVQWGRHKKFLKYRENGNESSSEEKDNDNEDKDTSDEDVFKFSTISNDDSGTDASDNYV